METMAGSPFMAFGLCCYTHELDQPTKPNKRHSESHDLFFMNNLILQTWDGYLSYPNLIY
jgi:hypothetical protein